MKKIILGITGASGHFYTKRFIELTHNLCNLEIIATDTASKVFSYETKENLSSFLKKYPKIKIHKIDNYFSKIASGSNSFDSLVILPCSMKTMGQISYGVGENLLTRVADISFKERRKIILVTREAPLSSIHLENMLRISKNGGIIFPASPGFYHNPKSIEDILDFMVQRIANLLELKLELVKPWAND